MKICPRCNRHNPGTYNKCPCGENIRYVPNIDKKTHKPINSQPTIQKSYTSYSACSTANNATRSATINNTDVVSADMTLSFICSLVTSAITSALFCEVTNSDFISMFLVFAILHAIGNAFLFMILSAFNANTIVKLIVCGAFFLINCIVFIPEDDYNVYDNSDLYNRTGRRTSQSSLITTVKSGNTTTKSGNKSLPEKPVDGMTFAELKRQKWGYKMLYTKCRDFDRLRPYLRYYEARWYDENFECIGHGLICFDNENEDEARLVNFKDYTE